MKDVCRVILAILLAIHCSAGGQPAGNEVAWTPEDYRLRIGDGVIMVATGSIYFAYSQTVSFEGTIMVQIPSGERSDDGSVQWMVMEEISVEDMTIGELTDLLQNKFTRYYKDIKINVRLTKTADPIYVSGAVVIPGTFPYFPTNGVEDYIGLAGGTTMEGSVEYAQIIRADGTLLQAHAVDFLKPGDTILVPSEFVYVQGAVNIPGAVPFRQNRTVDDYIGLAGGPTDRAHVKKVYLVRSDGHQEKISGDSPVDVGEIIVIPELTLKWPSDYLTIFGFISSTFVTWYLLTRS